MTPKRRGSYTGPGLRSGRRKVAQGAPVPTTEMEQTEPQEEVRDTARASKRIVPRAPRTRVSQEETMALDLQGTDRIAQDSSYLDPAAEDLSDIEPTAQDLSNADPTDPHTEEVPLVPIMNT